MGKDPYQYFRIEAREHVEGLSAGALELEKRPDDPELVPRLLRYAHTLKGAARVVRLPEISDLSHSIEELLISIRDGRSAADRADVSRLLTMIDAVGRHVGSLPQPEGRAAASPGQPAAPAPVGGLAPPTLDSVRIDVRDLDSLLHVIWEVGINVRALGQQAKALDRLLESGGGRSALSAEAGSAGQGGAAAAAAAAKIQSSLRSSRRTFYTHVERTERELLQLQDKVGQLRLLTAGDLFPSLERACRDTADAMGKRVEMQFSGGETRMDAHVLRGLGEALLHLVRNAVSHGIELPEERGAAGKPPAGRVEVAVERAGNRVRFTCRDDGRGIDVAQVRRAAAARGCLPAVGGEAVSAEQLMGLLLRGGISTADAVTEHSGRGVGLDVVRETAARLEGKVDLRSTPAAGTLVQITVPVSLESISVLEVEVGDCRVSLPFAAVRRVIQVVEADVARTPGGDTILFDGAPVPVAPLRRLLFPDRRTPSAAGCRHAIVIEANHVRVALGVDGLLGRSNVIVKPLPKSVAGVELILGACLDASGDPQGVLDPERLVEAVGRIAGTARPAAPPPRPCVLVVDDSLTTRMLEQTILEAAGYEVELAVSGEDGLAKARGRTHAIFVVDVEMPGMSGFEFIAAAKSDPDLQRTPAILVTSLDAPEDRARGLASGAAAYIVKGEFDEATFLGTVRRLVRGDE